VQQLVQFNGMVRVAGCLQVSKALPPATSGLLALLQQDG
jgi:hypothetical protein